MYRLLTSAALLFAVAVATPSVVSASACAASCAAQHAACTSQVDPEVTQCDASLAVCTMTCAADNTPYWPTDCDQVYNQCYYDCPRPNPGDMSYKPCQQKCMGLMNQCYGLPRPPVVSVASAFDGPWSPCENACVATSNTCFARCTCQPVACEQRCQDAVVTCTQQCRAGASVAVATRTAFPHVFGVAPKPLELTGGVRVLQDQYPGEACFNACYAKGDPICTAQCPCHGDGCLESCLQLTCTQQCRAPTPRRALAPTLPEAPNSKQTRADAPKPPSAACLEQHKYCLEGCEGDFTYCTQTAGRLRQPLCAQEQVQCHLNCETDLTDLCPAGLPPLDPHTTPYASMASPRAARLGRRFGGAHATRA